MAMALGFRPLPGPQAKPGLRPRHKPDCQKAKANGHKLVAMAQDIRYPGVRVYKPVGRELPLTGRLPTFDLYVSK